MGYPELLRVLGEEAAREAREVRAAADRECARILSEARAAADGARAAVLARVREESEAHRRASREAIALERERALLVERRRQLERLRLEALARLRGAGGPALDAALLAELLPEAGDGPLEVIVDPGAEAEVGRALASLDPAVAARAAVRAAPEARGGVALVAGRRVLDDTLPSRLDRAWTVLEAEVARLLFGEG
ncbi:V-type ATP synthase subunit E [Anaeromyxobacter sp. Fw109-5]|uniref:V-type ATP synthase subunit E n=1 Tax=Anaeromyxobacter sp. (strain Fw109-5) TaxID=404589 RepID=VATE_ANADF|nr:V-type ATP synthase subunit E [Anaeromyxobacter sp. Fw109-5]A7HDH2.1 RecName: Full=V-type ATP synthase subunit E; AltName: Full=V-ATPase subunit E [Anaeromyxobacter sp. Fw109-5]ABS26768.1 H+transporting two-sector ATPase E subunit [Anaeromyxobacter sp. Fw109-5]